MRRPVAKVFEAEETAITKASSPERDLYGEGRVVAHKVGEVDKDQIAQVMVKSLYFI